ncbi:MAG TPA: hypothetical protein ENK91_09550 [Bacteroidetes bacterium]|nr:hypothetical protein [Bacteroidota bacterium]
MKTTDAFTRGQYLIDTILLKMGQIKKWQGEFVSKIILLSLSMGGRFNFMQMGREGDYNEQTYRNNFEKPFDFLKFNTELVKHHTSKHVILVFDPSYITKSGKQTPNLGYFYSGKASRYKKGLEIGGIAAVDLNQNTAYHLEAIQSPAANKESVNDHYTLVDHYADLIIKRASELEQISNILVVDGYFPKYKFIEPIKRRTNLTVISRLRDDANLKYIYNGVKSKGRGRPKKYSGKVNTKKIDKRVFRKEYEDTDMIIYGAIVYSVSMKRKIKVAYVEFLDDSNKVSFTKIFFSTDIDMDATIIVKYYKSRFQIEYLYRDSKQFTGLEHCQARSENKLYFHFNTSLTAVSIGKILLRDGLDKSLPMSLSISDIKTEFRNRNMIFRIFSMYGFDQTLIKINPDDTFEHKIYRALLNFGKIAA